MSIPIANIEIPKAFLKLLTNAGKKWKEINRDNLFDKEYVAYWGGIIAAWAKDKSMPIIIRNTRSIRGSVIIHETGREIIFSDNSPAKWVAEQVFLKQKPTLNEIKLLLKHDKIPFKFAANKDEQQHAKYKCISKNGLNRAGWKLCHIESVGLKNLKKLENQDIELLSSKFVRLLDPSNFFILPKAIGGLGEIRVFIDA